tara:strand:- start:7262 stop:7870 length:609 start_codon:yes stop_codon:yes gene_type:complete
MLLIFFLSLSQIKLSGETIKNYGYLKDIKINKSLLIDRKVSDFINLTMKDCNIKKSNYKFLESGVYSLIESKDKKELCESLTEEQIKLKCYPERLDFFMSDLSGDYVKRPKGLPYYYPVISKESINKKNIFKRRLNCFINKVFKEKNQKMELILSYELNMKEPKIGKMKLKEREYNIIISNTELIPEIDNFKIERKRIVVVD